MPPGSRTLSSVFGKRSDDDSTNSTAVADDTPSVNAPPAASPKGRATPTRKEAEAARKAVAKGGPPPGASKKEAKAAQRKASANARAKNRAAVLAGDERALPARDQGPVRGFTRDFVDSRRTVAEFFVPVAVVVLLLGLMRNVKIQVFVTMVWIVVLAIVILDTGLMLFRLQNQLKKQWPDKSDRKGVTFYAIMRALQIRRLRLPPPRFKAGGRPVTPKAPKQPKS